MSSLIHYLIVYSHDDQVLLDLQEFRDANTATTAYRDTEERYRGKMDHYEVVLVGADSVDTVKRTHGHYFMDPLENPAFEDLLLSL